MAARKADSLPGCLEHLERCRNDALERKTRNYDHNTRVAIHIETDRFTCEILQWPCIDLVAAVGPPLIVPAVTLCPVEFRKSSTVWLINSIC